MVITVAPIHRGTLDDALQHAVALSIISFGHEAVFIRRTLDVRPPARLK
jgi:hypothetical protein